MARILTAGFETGSIHELNGASSIVTETSNTQHRTGNHCLPLTGSILKGATAYKIHVFESDLSEFFYRVAWKCVFSTTVRPHIQFLDSGGDEQLTLEFDGPTQTFRVYRGKDSQSDPAGTLLASGTAVIRNGFWYVLEGHVVVSNSTGEFTLKVNAITDIAYTGDTQITDMDSIRAMKFFGAWGGGNLYIDDVAVNDTTGAYQNSWIGLGGVDVLVPNGEGAVQQWSPSEGTTHWDLVNDVPAGTTHWVQSSNAGNELELFEIAPPPAYITSIDVVNVVYQAAVAESGSQALEDVIRQGTVNYPGGGTVTVISIAPDWVLYQGTAHYVQPNGSGAWGTVAIDALQMGVLTAV